MGNKRKVLKFANVLYCAPIYFAEKYFLLGNKIHFSEVSDSVTIGVVGL